MPPEPRPTTTGRVTIAIRLLALLASGFAFVLTVGVLFAFSFSAVVATLLAAFLCTVIAALFAARYPDLGWRWGLWASALFLIYFVVVIVAYLIAGRSAWHPLIPAVITLGAACGTAAVVAAIRRPSRPEATSP